MKVYKLTDKDGYTRRGESGETLWAPGVTRKTTGEGDLCGPGWTHAYEHPLLALLHDPIHGKYSDEARLWVCDAYGKIECNGQVELGATELTCIREIKKPNIKIEQRVAYGALCTIIGEFEEESIERAEIEVNTQMNLMRCGYCSATFAAMWAAYRAKEAWSPEVNLIERAGLAMRFWA